MDDEFIAVAKQAVLQALSIIKQLGPSLDLFLLPNVNCSVKETLEAFLMR